MKTIEEQARQYTVTVQPDGEGGYVAEVAEFPGVLAAGDTPTEALASAYTGIAAIIAVQIEDGEPVPPPLVTVGGQL